MRLGTWWIAGLTATCCGLSAAQTTSSAAEIAALRRQLDALSQQVRDLEARFTADGAAAATAERADSPRVTLDASGLRIRSADDALEHRMRLRLAHDFAWFGQDDALQNTLGDEQDGTDFRFARLLLQGRVWDDFTYQAEIEFAGQDGTDAPKFRDVYVQYHGIPYGGDRGFDLRIGHFKEPFSLDELNAVTVRQLLEAPLMNVFVPSRNAGLQVSDALLGEPKAERLAWALGVFRETDDLPSSNDADEDQGWQVTGRVSGLPVYADGGRRLLHLGFAYSRRNPDGARLRYGLRPESRLALFRYADPDNLPVGFRLRDARADDVNLYGIELAGVCGPVSLQSEYVRSDVDTSFGGDLNFDGWYVQGAWLLTGEHRPYRHDSGRFDAPKPARPFRLKAAERGWGAWEVAARYGAVDLSDGPVRGGEHESLTFGLNWYLNPNVRVSANYIRNDVEHDLYNGAFDVFQTRLQLEF